MNHSVLSEFCFPLRFSTLEQCCPLLAMTDMVHVSPIQLSSHWAPATGWVCLRNWIFHLTHLRSSMWLWGYLLGQHRPVASSPVSARYAWILMSSLTLTREHSISFQCFLPINSAATNTLIATCSAYPIIEAYR